MLLESVNIPLTKTKDMSLLAISSVTNAAVFLPNWATSKFPAAGQKTVGRVA